MGKWGGGEVLRRAVRGMLPKNRLRDVRLARLKSELIPSNILTWGVRIGTRWLISLIAFEGPAHPHKANILKYPGEKVFSVAKDQPERVQPESISTQKVETAPIASP